MEQGMEATVALKSILVRVLEVSRTGEAHSDFDAAWLHLTPAEQADWTVALFAELTQEHIDQLVADVEAVPESSGGIRQLYP